MTHAANYGEPPYIGAVPLNRIEGEDEEDTRLLRKMADDAIAYLRSFKWFVEMGPGYFGDGIGGVVGIFLFGVKIKGFDHPQWLWIIVGDLPSTYMMAGDCPSPRLALNRYIDGLSEWATAAEKEEDLHDLIPIDCPPTLEFVRLLRNRIELLTTHILPNIS